jgi:hypothetical protein
VDERGLKSCPIVGFNINGLSRRVLLPQSQLFLRLGQGELRL